MKNKLRVLDLFSGIGGFSLGLERTGGFETVAFCEIEDFPRRVIAKHWPDVPCYRDVRELTAERLAADGIAVDVICGGFPCQDISTAGKGAGLSGERSGLFYEVARLVGELGPRFVILENVGALLSRGLDAVLGTLASLGYDAEWHCIPASAVGAPHRRDRVWIVAYPQGIRRDQGNQNIIRRVGQCAEAFARFTNRGEIVADTVRIYGEGEQSIIAKAQEWPRQIIRSVRSRNHGAGWWSTEPELGGSLDGFSLWLDGFDLSEPHKLLMAYANAENARPCETLRTLRDGVFPQDDEWQAGGPFGISPQTVLFAFLRQLEKRAVDEARLQLEGAEASGEELRSLRTRQKPSRASHRSESCEQRSGEHSNALQALSRLLAYHAEKAWLAYRRSDAAPPLGWESGVARVANGIKDRTHRLKALGNAVVPQIPELIGNAILDAIGWRDAA